jgi:hypothetical protein
VIRIETVLKLKTKISRKGKSKLNEITAARISELLSLQLPWRKTTSAQYKDCPHEYIIRERCDDVSAWDEFAALVKTYGTMRTWRNHCFRYLTFDGMIYWIDRPVLNRSLECSLKNAGWPSKPSQARILSRFGN